MQRRNFRIITIEKLKKELGLTNTKIAEFFGLTAGAYANSSAKKRYEDALCNFYAFVKSKAGVENIKTGNTTTDD